MHIARVKSAILHMWIANQCHQLNTALAEINWKANKQPTNPEERFSPSQYIRRGITTDSNLREEEIKDREGGSSLQHSISMQHQTLNLQKLCCRWHSSIADSHSASNDCSYCRCSVTTSVVVERFPPIKAHVKTLFPHSFSKTEHTQRGIHFYEFLYGHVYVHSWLRYSMCSPHLN